MSSIDIFDEHEKFWLEECKAWAKMYEALGMPVPKDIQDILDAERAKDRGKIVASNIKEALKKARADGKTRAVGIDRVGRPINSDEPTN